MAIDPRAILDPQSVTDQQDVEFKRQMAQALMQRAMTPMQGQMAGNVYVAPSWTQALAGVVGGFAGRKLQSQASEQTQTMNQRYADALQKMFNPPEQPPQPGQGGPAPDNMIPPQQGGAQAMPLASAAAPSMPQAGMQAAPAQGNPLNPYGIDPKLQLAAALGLPNAQETLKAQIADRQRTELQKNMGAMGQDPALMGQLGIAEARKRGIIEYQPGTTAQDLATGQTHFQPTVAPGVQLNNGVASPVPGYAQTAAGLTAANAQATEGAKMMTVNMPDGSTRQMTQAQYQQATQPQTGNSPAVQAAAARNGDQNYAFNVGGQQGAIGGTQAAPQGGLGQSANPVAQKAAEAFASNRAVSAGDYGKALDEKVQTGNDLKARMQEARGLLTQFNPGMGAETRLNIARFAQSMGAPDSLVERINQGDVSAKQEFVKLSAQTAMESLKQAMGGSGRITQSEFKVFQANNPNIELDPRAIEKIYNFADKAHQRNFAEQQAYDKYVNEDNGNPSRFPAWYAKKQMDKQPDSTVPANKPNVMRFDAQGNMVQ